MRMQAPTPPRWQKILGIVLTVVPVFMLAMSAVMKLSQSPELIEGFGKAGIPPTVIVPIGVEELVSVILYAIPQTAILGAILLTGHLGGAIAIHVRIGEPFHVPLLIGVVVWAGLWLRDPRVRALLPLRR